MIEVRPATAADAASLAELRWEFRSAKTPPTEDRDGFVARCAEWMRGELASGRWHAWVAEESGRIAGQIWLFPMPKIPNPSAELERHAYVSNVYVTPGARGGIGSRLLETAIAWAMSNEVDRVVLWPTARSRTLYQRFGFTVSGNVLELRLAT